MLFLWVLRVRGSRACGEGTLEINRVTLGVVLVVIFRAMMADFATGVRRRRGPLF